MDPETTNNHENFPIVLFLCCLYPKVNKGITMQKFIYFILVLGFSTVAMANVTAPNATQSYLTVKGEVGVGQNDYFNVYQCQFGDFGYAVGSCRMLNQSFSLNRAVTLAPGIYMLRFNGSIATDVILAPGHHVLLELKKLFVPAQAGTSYDIFVDYHDSSEQLKFAKFFYALLDKSELYCEEKHLCAAIKAGPAALINIIVRFNDRSSPVVLSERKSADRIVTRYNIDQANWARDWWEWSRTVIKGRGAFVSVFPGTYAIGYSINGSISEQYGIIVQ